MTHGLPRVWDATGMGTESIRRALRLHEAADPGIGTALADEAAEGFTDGLDDILILAEMDGLDVGYLHGSLPSDGAFVHAIVVAPAVRRMGVGRQMLSCFAGVVGVRRSIIRLTAVAETPEGEEELDAFYRSASFRREPETGWSYIAEPAAVTKQGRKAWAPGDRPGESSRDFGDDVVSEDELLAGEHRLSGMDESMVE